MNGHTSQRKKKYNKILEHFDNMDNIETHTHTYILMYLTFTLL